MTPLPKRVPLFLFIVAVVLAAFAAGMYVHWSKVFPYEVVHSAYSTAKTLIEFHGPRLGPKPQRFVDISPGSVEARRFEFLAADALTDPILVPGGLGQFAETCPGEAGCLAVKYADRGRAIHAYPFRPEEIESAPPRSALPYEQPPGFSLRKALPDIKMAEYPNGDLLVVFLSEYSFPYGLGVARIDREGRPIWYRRDYSHHEPYITKEGVALVPSGRIGAGPLIVGEHFELKCEKPYHDFIHVIDGSGRLIEEISILHALLESPYFPILRFTDPCNPTHLNFIHELGEDAGGATDIGPGDFAISLRNIDAFAILDRDTHRMKRLVRGKFFRQHSVMHFEGSRFLMFANSWGVPSEPGTHGPSRLLMVDVANGVETPIFPNDATPEPLRNLFSFIQGGISISPDRRRALVTFSGAGKAVEVRIEDGTVLSVFNALHDVSHLASFPEDRKSRAAQYRLMPVRYSEGE